MVNDDIERRIQLKLNLPISSNTVGCTVQRSCVDEKLTGRCITYHNDQWFDFIAGNDSILYLNLSQQHCRDINGIQVVVLEGEPCVTSTYKILNCYSTGTHDDVFIMLTGLKPEHTYLVNIDGYLHDLCAFNLEISDVPKGFPSEISGGLNFRGKPGLCSQLSWSVNPELSSELLGFEIWKRALNESSSSLVAEVPFERNTVGAPALKYELEDCRSSGKYKYTIIGIGDRQRYRFGEYQIRADSMTARTEVSNFIQLNLAYRKGESLTIILYEGDGNQVLRRVDILFDPLKHANLRIFTRDYLEKGITSFRVDVLEKKSRKKTSKIYYMGR